MGPVGIANLPNQQHRLVYRKGAHFTIMVVGQAGLGKTTFLNTLFTTSVLETKPLGDRHARSSHTVDIEITKAVIEEKGFAVRLTVIDTPGFGDYVNNDRCWEPIIKFIDDQHEAYLKQESQARRSNITDLRVHACLYFIAPTGHALSPLDVAAMRAISSRVNLIPVIAKADTLTPAALAVFKEKIRESISVQNISVYSCPIESDDEESSKRNVEIMNSMPFSVIGSTEECVTADGRRVFGRTYPWGIAEVENEQHCDFKNLRSLLIRTHMYDLISTTNEIHFENYRINRLANRHAFIDQASAAKARQVLEKKMAEDEEALRRKFTEQVKAEEVRFRNWEQKLIQERDRLNKNLETEHYAIRGLQVEVEAIEAKLSRAG